MTEAGSSIESMPKEADHLGFPKHVVQGRHGANPRDAIHAGQFAHSPGAARTHASRR